MRYVLILLIALYSYGGVLDFNYLNKAKEAYSKGDYTQASQNYAKVNNDEARYDLANSLYKQKKYKEALDSYSAISDKNLEFKKLHNMGNTLAQLGKTDEAIKAYEDALKIREDKDTKFNLELLKKQKKDKKKKQDKNKDKKKNKDNKKKQDKKNKKDKSSQDKNKKQSKDKNEKQKSQKDTQNQQKKSDKKSQDNASENKKKREDSKEQQKQKQQKVKKDEKQTSKQAQQKKNQPISNMEERKWQKMLNQKQINTLMLPIRKGEKNNEKTPW